MLTTAAFRIPPRLLGEVCVYPLPPRFRHEFSELGRRWRSRNERARTPYASLATALMAVTGRPVRILPRTNWKEGDVLLVTTEPIDAGVLSTSIRTWERLCRGSDTNVLWPLLAGVTPEMRPIAEAIRNPDPGRVAAESWVYDVLGWIIAQRLATKPVAFDHVRVPFRIDTCGSLVAWDNPILKTRRGKDAARALMKVTPHIKTLPGSTDLVCLLDASLTRLVDGFFDVKNVWIEHGRGSGGSALLRLPVYRRKTDEGWRSLFADYSADVVAACGLDPLPWGEDVLTEHLDLVRAWRATPGEHSIGVGVGSRAYLRLVEHAESVLGIEPISYRPFRGAGSSGPAVKVLSTADGARLDPQALDAAVSAAGFERLRLVHLSATTEARARVREELRHYQAERTPALTAELGVVQEVGGRTDIVVYDVAHLLSHGKIDRSLMLSEAPLLKADPGSMVLALVETEFAGEAIVDDAKNELRRLLAELGVASQFLATPPHQEDGVGKPEPSRRTDRRTPATDQAVDQAAEPLRDFPAGAAIKDIMRCGGLTDGRLARAVTLQPFALDRTAWLVGVHVRRQNAPRGTNGGGPKPRPTLVTVLVAVQAHPEPDRPWPIYLYRPGSGWLPHAAGLASYHAAPIGAEIAPDQAAYPDVRALVDQSLRTLPSSGAVPIVVMVDGEATRRIWSGLSDSHLGTKSLPGDRLPSAADVSVIRVGADDTAAPRPVHRAEGGRRPRDERAPASPGAQIYVHTGDDGTRSWMLGKTSKTFSAGADGRCGNDYTRFTLPVQKARLQSKPWHSFTGTELVVARAGVLEADAVAALTARLCAQPVSWDGRTRWPVPLHLARIADDTHPLRGGAPDSAAGG